MVDIEKRIKSNPQKKYLVIYVIACHGMNSNGQQVIVLNEYEKSSGFYKIFGMESNIRKIARENPNSY